MVYLFFIRSYLGDKAVVGGLETCWNGRPWNEVDGVGAAPDIVLDALGKAAKILHIVCVPCCSVGDAKQLVDLLFNARVWVKDGVGFGEEVGWIGGFSISEVGNGHAAREEGVVLVLAQV